MRSRSLTLMAFGASAILACAHASTKDHRSAEIHHDLGVEALRAGRFPDALRELDAALALDDAFAEAHRARALVLDLAFARLEEAEREYRRAVALRPSFSEAHSDLGQLLARTGRYDEAISHFDAALENMLYKEPYVARAPPQGQPRRGNRRAARLPRQRAVVLQRSSGARARSPR